MMIKKTRTNILVVTTYTKRFGIAVFCQSELVYFAVKTFRLPRTIQSVEAETSVELKNLIDEFVPKLVIVKTLTHLQINSENQRQVFEEIKRVAHLRTTPIKGIAFEDVKQKPATVLGKPTKMSTFAVLAAMYPELKKFTQFQNRSQEEYYTSLLSAVAIGMAHQSMPLLPGPYL